MEQRGREGELRLGNAGGMRGDAQAKESRQKRRLCTASRPGAALMEAGGRQAS